MSHGKTPLAVSEVRRTKSILIPGTEMISSESDWSSVDLNNNQEGAGYEEISDEELPLSLEEVSEESLDVSAGAGGRRLNQHQGTRRVLSEDATS